MADNHKEAGAAYANEIDSADFDNLKLILDNPHLSHEAKDWFDGALRVVAERRHEKTYSELTA